MATKTQLLCLLAVVLYNALAATIPEEQDSRRSFSRLSNHLPVEGEEHHKVKNYGVYFDLMANDIGVDMGATIDLSAGYRFPFYDLNQFIVAEPQGRLNAGSFAYLTVGMYMVRLNIFLEAMALEFIPAALALYWDVAQYRQVCIRLRYYLKTLYTQMKVQIDVNECLFGLFGAIF